MVEKNMESKAIRYSTTGLVQVALFAAFAYVATAVINFPYGKGVVHLGDSVVFLAAILIGKRKGAAAAAIGMCLFDILSPYAIWAPFTFIIKGLMAYIAGSIAYRNNYKGENIKNNILAFVLGGVWMIVAYLFAGTFLNYLTVTPDILKSFYVATYDIPGNITQVVVGIVIALPLAKMLKKSIKF